MNFKSKLVSVFGAGIIALSMVGGVAANNQAQVNVQVNRDGSGTLTYSLQARDFNGVNTSYDQNVTSQGTLELTVKDGRFTQEGWTITMSGTTFTSGTSATIPISNFSVTPESVVADKGQSNPMPAAKSLTMSTNPQTALEAPRGSGSGEYKATYRGSVSVPANTPAGTYTTTITVNHGAGPN